MLLLWLLFPAGMLFAQEVPGDSFRVPEHESGSFKPTDTIHIKQLWKQAARLQHNYPDSAVALLETAASCSRQKNYSYGIARSLAHMGTVHVHTGRYREGIALMKESIYYAVRSGQSAKLLPIIYKDLGGVYILLGDYEQGALYSYQAAVFAEKARSYAHRSNILNNLAALMLTVDSNAGGGMHYLNLAEKYSLASGDPVQITTAFLNKGGYYLMRNSWDQATEYLNRAVQTARKYGYTEKEHNALMMLGQSFQGRGDYPLSLSLFSQAAALNGNINPYYRIMNQTLTGTSYLAMKRYGKAEKLFSQAARTSEKMSLHYNLAEIHHNQYRLYRQWENPEKALVHFEQYTLLRDSLRREESVRNIHQIESRYRIMQKDRELLQQEIELGRQSDLLRRKTFWIILAASSAVVLAALLAAGYLLLRHRQRIQLGQLRHLRQEHEISVLRAAIDGEEKERSRLARELHDGIGGLLTAVRINYMVLGQQAPPVQHIPAYRDVLEMLGSISREVRKTSHNLMPEILLRHSLPEAIRIYCDRILSDAAIRADIQAFGPFEKLPQDLNLLIYRMIQELVQNVVKHAGATGLIIHLLLREKLLSLTVEDNGCGFRPDTLQDGMGIQSLRTRVAGLSGILSIESAPGQGTSVYIEIPLQQYNPQKSP